MERAIRKPVLITGTTERIMLHADLDKFDLCGGPGECTNLEVDVGPATHGLCSSCISGRFRYSKAEENDSRCRGDEGTRTAW